MKQPASEGPLKKRDVNFSRASLHEHWYNCQNHVAPTKFRLDCRVAGEDGARAIEVMGPVIKSMQTSAWVDLPLKEEAIPPQFKLLPAD